MTGSRRVTLDWPIEGLEDGESQNYTDVFASTGQVERETQRAVLFIMGGEDQWIPRSCLRICDQGHIWVADWFIEKEGLDV